MAQPFGVLTVGEDAAEGLREPRGVARLDQEPVGAVLDEIRDPADPAADHGPPAAERLHHDASHPLRARGQDETRGLVERRGDLRRPESGRPRGPPREVRDESPDKRRERTRADDPEHRVRHVRRRAAPRVREPVDVLVALEHADEERLRAIREGHGR